MHENIIGEKCPVCGSRFFETDEIVFCPECGAPYHRECYRHCGKCVFEEKHGDFEWKGDKQELKEHYENIEKSSSISSSERTDNGDTIYSVNSMDEFKEMMDNRLLKQEKDFPEVDGVTAEELIKFVNKNAYYYLPVFGDIVKRGKLLKLNFAAFLFFPLHCFYRRMNLLGTITMIISMLTIEARALVYSFADSLALSTDSLKLIYIAILLVAAAINLFIFMFFNYFYFRTAVKKIKTIKAECGSYSREELLERISAEGRPSLFNSIAFTACVFFAVSLAFQLLNNYLGVNLFKFSL